MTNPMDVSVLICTRDRSDMLESCLDSVLGCSPAPAEIVVVDQSRDEESRKAVDRRRGGPVPLRYLRGVGTGLSRAKNQGAAGCAGAVIAFTDDDCRVDPGWVEALTEPVRSGRAEAVAGRTLPDRSAGAAPETFSVYVPERPPIFSHRTHPWRVGGGGNFAVRRDTLRAMGPYDERFGPGAPLESAEDMDMMQRLLRSGARVVYSPEAIVWHRSWRSTSQSLRLSRAYGIGAGGFFTKQLLAGDWIGGWRFAARLGVRTLHLLRAMLRLDRRGIAEQSVYLAALFEGAGRLIAHRGPASDGVTDLGRGAA